MKGFKHALIGLMAKTHFTEVLKYGYIYFQTNMTATTTAMSRSTSTTSTLTTSTATSSTTSSDHPPSSPDEKQSGGNKLIKNLCFKARKGVQWVWKDLKKPHLLWVKIVFMLQSASLVTLYPYLIVHLRSLGFTIEDASIVNTAVPLADIVAPPLAGLLADKIGNFRVFMAVITFVNGAASLLLLVVNNVAQKNDANVELCCVDQFSSTNSTFCFNVFGQNVDKLNALKNDSVLSCIKEGNK